MAKNFIPRREMPVTDWRQVPALMDLHRAAFIVGLRPETVRKAMARREFPGRKVMGEWRVRKDELMACLGYSAIEIEKYGYGRVVSA